MYIVAIHDISDPEKFWGAIREAQTPEGITVHSTLPNAGGTKAVCLWEADSVQAVANLVDATVGSASTNQYFEVDAKNALGLPQ